MTFFYDLNKKLDGIREKPETTHKQLNERAIAEKISPPIETNPAERGKYTGKDIGDLKAMKAANLKRTAGYRERGEKVPDELKGKTAELNFAIRAKQAHGGKWGKIKEADLAETMTDDKTAAQQALQALGQGNNQDMIKDLQRRAGVPQTGKVQTGQQPMSEDDMEEGNKFTGNLMKARAAGKKQADLDGDGDMEPVREAAKPDYIDLDNDGNRRESMKKAAADKKKSKQEVEEGWDDMLKAADERRREGMRSGEKTQGHKGEIEKTATGIKHTRRYDAKTGETDSDDDEKPAGEKRGRGRPKKTDKAPERVTAKAYKHKGGRKMSNEEIQEAIAALEEAGYSVEERKLSSSEREEREDIVKGMKKNRAGFKKRYGDRGEEVMYATATKLAKERGPGNPDRKKKEKSEEVEETTVAGSVAPSAAAPKSKSKGGMTFGKGIYDSLNRELEGMISESMNVSVNMSMDDAGQPRKNITVSAEGEAAEQLAQLLNLAGMAAHNSSHSDTCSTCGQADCGCQELDENQPDWPTDQETIGDNDPLMRRYAGGLNGPKSTGQTVGAPFNRQDSRQGVMDEAAPQSMQRVGKAAGEVLGAGIGFALGAIPGAIIGGVALGPGGAIGGGLGTGLPVAMTGTTLGGSAGRSAANFTHDTLVNAWRKASAKLGGPEATAEFIKAHAQAADYGKDAFDFGGKKYAVTMDRMQARKAMNDLAKMTAGSKEPVSEESVKVEESVDELTKLWKTYKG